MEKKLVTVATHSFERAELLRTLLESEGIQVITERVNLLGGTFKGGERIRVMESDLERAMKLVESAYYQMVRDEHVPMRKRGGVRILIPLDFKRDVQDLCQMGFDLAAKTNGSLMFVHVYYSPIVTGMPFSNSFAYDVDLAGSVREIAEEAKVKMETFVAGLRTQIKAGKYPEIPINFELLGGLAEDEIIAFCEEYRPHTILMKCSERKEGDRLGSVAAEVMSRASVPVFALPGGNINLNIQKKIHLMYLTHFDEHDFVSFDKLMRFLSPFDICFSLVHFSKKEDDRLDSLRLQGMKEAFIKRYGSNCEVDTHIEIVADVACAIEKFVKDKGIDVVSFTTKRRNVFARFFLSGLSDEMIARAKIPSLVFHS